MVLIETPQIVTPVTWLEMPELLTIPQACRLSGADDPTMRWMIGDGAVIAVDDAEDGEYFVDKDSLEQFQETLALVLHWDD